MSLTNAQITKLKGLVALHSAAQIGAAFAGSYLTEDANSARVYAELTAIKLDKYIDGLAIVPRTKGCADEPCLTAVA